jgi:hypothetical protein
MNFIEALKQASLNTAEGKHSLVVLQDDSFPRICAPGLEEHNGTRTQKSFSGGTITFIPTSKVEWFLGRGFVGDCWSLESDGSTNFWSRSSYAIPAYNRFARITREL